MPRVLRIINRFNLGGPVLNAAYLSCCLPDDYETLLVGGGAGPHEEPSLHIPRAMGVEPLVLPEMQREVAPWRDRAAYRRLKRIIRDFKPDIVHTHAAKAGAVGRLAATVCGVPVVVHTFHGHVFHSYFGAARSNIYKQVERYLAKRTSAIVAISERQREELLFEHRICPAEKLSVVPLGFDLERFQNDREAKRTRFRRFYGLQEDEVAVGIIGRLVPVKNHALFLQAVAKVAAATERPLRFFVIGDGEEREPLLQLARELGLSTAVEPWGGVGGGRSNALVTFTSWIKEPEIACAGLDLVVLTSHNEGTPVSLIEAQASGTPVVSTRVGGVENVVADGITGLLVEPGDVQGTARAVLDLANDRDLRQRMGAQGWPQVGERYHYKRLVTDMDRLYRRLLAEHALRTKGSAMGMARAGGEALTFARKRKA